MIPATGDLVEGGVVEQAEQALKNLGAILQKGGSSFGAVVKTTVILSTMDNFKLANDVYTKYFGEHRPARACFAALQLPKGALFEIEAVAMTE